MVRSHSFTWILVSLLSLTLAVPLQADITPSGDVDPTDYSWWTGGGDSSTHAYIGKTGTGSVTINSGSTDDLSSNYGYIGYSSGSTGVVTVDGIDSTWTCGYLDIGYQGHGTLNITNGGVVNVADDTWVARYEGAAGEIHFDGGMLTMTGSLLAGATQLTGTGTINTHGLVSDVDLLFDSTHGPNQTLTLDSQPGQNITINLTQDSTGYLGAGYAGNGTLAIRDGVSVESSGGHIGYKAGATGVVTVDGSGSAWINGGGLSVGDDGQGTLNITNGGAVSNFHGYIGCQIGSTGVVTVNGIGSTWSSSGSLDVSYFGHGTLNITSGGAVSNFHGYIGCQIGSTGVVTVNGIGSTWTNNGSLVVGFAGHGTLNITNGGTVSSGDGYISCYCYTGSAGVVTVDGSGSTWTNSESLYVGGNARGRGGPGVLTLSNGGAVNVGGTLKIWSIGTVQGDGTITANVVINAGAVKPGISPGTLSVNGDYTQEAGGLLEIEIGGLVPGTDHDQVIITDTANLAGTLDLSLIGEYVPGFYDEFEIVTAGTLNGTFDTITGYSVNSGMSLAVVYDYDADNVTVVAAIPGDATLDASVTGADYTVYALNYGTGSSWEESDFNGDGAVTGADYTIYALNYTGSPIPEPATLSLLALGGLAMLRRRRSA